MDPDMTLHEIRELIHKVLVDKEPSAGYALAEKVDALDGWLAKGGFVPGAWLATEDHR